GIRYFHVTGVQTCALPIFVPVLSPILTRKKSLAEEIAALDVNQFSCPVLPRKQDDAVAKSFRYEGYDLITLEKLIERDYTIPERSEERRVEKSEDVGGLVK